MRLKVNELISVLKRCGSSGPCMDCPLKSERLCTDVLKLQAAEMLESFITDKMKNTTEEN